LAVYSFGRLPAFFRAGSASGIGPFRVFLSQTADQPRRLAIPSCCCQLITPGVPICVWRFATTHPPESAASRAPSRSSARNRRNSKVSMLCRRNAIARQSRSQHLRIPASCEPQIIVTVDGGGLSDALCRAQRNSTSEFRCVPHVALYVSARVERPKAIEAGLGPKND